VEAESDYTRKRISLKSNHRGEEPGGKRSVYLRPPYRNEFLEKKKTNMSGGGDRQRGGGDGISEKNKSSKKKCRRTKKKTVISQLHGESTRKGFTKRKRTQNRRLIKSTEERKKKGPGTKEARG